MIKFLVILYLHLLENIHDVIKFYSIWVIIFAHPLLTLDTKMEDIHFSIDIPFGSLWFSSTSASLYFIC